MYNTYSAGDYINLRSELSSILNGTGYYVGWRKFDLTKRSQYWNNVAKEAVGGPPWKFEDYVFKTRRIQPTILTSKEAVLKYGSSTSEGLLYYSPYNIDIKSEDILFRIEGETSKFTGNIRIKKVYTIDTIEPKIDGELIYNVIRVTIRQNINDETIRGLLPATLISV